MTLPLNRKGNRTWAWDNRQKTQKCRDNLGYTNGCIWRNISLVIYIEVTTETKENLETKKQQTFALYQVNC